MKRILGIHVGDRNGDGKNELIVIRDGGIEIYTRLGEGFGKTYELELPIKHFLPRSIKIEDVDADGFPELVIGYIDRESKIRIEVYKFDRKITDVIASIPGGEIYGIFVSDINKDKDLEIIAFGSNSQGFTTMTIRSITKPKLMRIARVPIGKKIVDCNLGDVDGDGELEAIVLTDEGVYYRKQEEQRFIKAPIEAYDIHTIEVSDINGDLFMEVLLASRSGIYIYAYKELFREINKGSERLIVHDIDNDGADEIITIYLGRFCLIDPEIEKEECKSLNRHVEYLSAGKFGDKRLVIGANEEEFFLIHSRPFKVPNVLDEFARVSEKFKPKLAEITLELAFPTGKYRGLEGEMIKEARRLLERSELNKAYRIIYEFLDGVLPNPKKAARIAVLLAFYLMKNPTSEIREKLSKLAKETKKKKRELINPREALERIKQGIATEDDVFSAVYLYIKNPLEIRGKVSRFFDVVRRQLGNASALDALLTIFTVAPKSIQAEILITIMYNYYQGLLSPNEIRSAFKRAAQKHQAFRDLFEFFADIVHRYGQRGMAAAIVALSYYKANPKAVEKLFSKPPESFRLSRPSRLEEIPMPDVRLVPLILYGRVEVIKRGDYFIIRPKREVLYQDIFLSYARGYSGDKERRSYSHDPSSSAF